MGTDWDLTAMVFHRCFEIDWEGISVRDGFVSHDFRAGESYGLEEESIPAAKRMRSDDVVPL